jgi:hypothetical protein
MLLIRPHRRPAMTLDELKALVPGDTIDYGDVYEVIDNDVENERLQVVQLSARTASKLDYDWLGDSDKIRSGPTSDPGPPGVDEVKIANSANSAIFVSLSVDLNSDLIAANAAGLTQNITSGHYH